MAWSEFKKKSEKGLLIIPFLSSVNQNKSVHNKLIFYSIIKINSLLCFEYPSYSYHKMHK